MNTLNTPPSPEPPAEPAPTGPACVACGLPALVHWVRRLTDDELDEVRRVESERRAEVIRLAYPQLAPPVFPPLPTGEDFTRTVYSCGPHAITMDAAALVHASSCTAPNDTDLPGCDCTPEPAPAAPVEEIAAAPLPDHWVTGGA
ncbi:hypothetical protein ACFXKC_40815 [Streptomyces sp. NPDC059340]|uniref:hypothetical protein n=1 Tax=Streptomyces sp. NPDC059340 TaxID=3346806 RepID=UPI0036901403